MEFMNMKNEAIVNLKSLIQIPSVSREEQKTADYIENYLKLKGASPKRLKNNVYCLNKHFDEKKPSILMASHHDTVPACSGYTRDPLQAQQEGDVLFGLGSNDAGASLVSYMGVFLELYSLEQLNFNIIFAATAEEEVSGANGMELLWKNLPNLSLALMGEPTGMDMAIAEKGLIVIDCMSEGEAGHAARSEGENAIYKAIKDVKWIEEYKFPKKSPVLGNVKMSVTQIDGGVKHNVTPDSCKFVIDVRPTECYSNQEIVNIIAENISAKVIPRSLRLTPSSIDQSHSFVKIGNSLGCELYGSDTLSDQALIHGIPTLKIGPGESARSHRPNEFVKISEIHQGMDRLKEILIKYNNWMEV